MFCHLGTSFSMEAWSTVALKVSIGKGPGKECYWIKWKYQSGTVEERNLRRNLSYYLISQRGSHWEFIYFRRKNKGFIFDFPSKYFLNISRKKIFDWPAGGAVLTGRGVAEVALGEDGGLHLPVRALEQVGGAAIFQINIKNISDY